MFIWRAATMPHMEVVDRLWQLPVVESAWNTSFDLYGRVKNAHGLAHWTLSTAEGVATRAVETIAPLANKLSTPIHVVDMKLCQGLDIIEQKMPIVKEQPQQVGEVLIYFQPKELADLSPFLRTGYVVLFSHFVTNAPVWLMFVVFTLQKGQANVRCRTLFNFSM